MIVSNLLFIVFPFFKVDCLSDLCGLTPFFKPDNPDHLQRLGLALFLHAG